VGLNDGEDTLHAGENGKDGRPVDVDVNHIHIFFLQNIPNGLVANRQLVLGFRVDGWHRDNFHPFVISIDSPVILAGIGGYLMTFGRQTAADSPVTFSMPPPMGVPFTATEAMRILNALEFMN
jgi:hypothetical protein